MKVTLVLLVMLVLAPEVVAMPGAVWRGKRIHVYDHTSPAWDGFVEQAVDDANAILPKRSPRVIYHRMEAATCDVVPKHRRGITVCSGGEMWWQDIPAFAHSGNFAKWNARKQITSQATVYLTEGGWNRRKVLCHELIGHAILGLTHSDGYNTMTPGESCLHASAETPGTWDVSTAQSLYKKLSHDSGPRSRRGRKH